MSADAAASPSGSTSTDRDGFKYVFAVVAFIVVAVVTVAWNSRVGEGHRALAECDAATARGDFTVAIAAARAAAEARCPAGCVADRGYARLAEIAGAAEGHGDMTTAFAAWNAARAAALGTIAIGRVPPQRERAETELARLGQAMDAAASASGAKGSPAASQLRLRAALAVNDVPSSATFAFLGVGGALFLYGAARFAATAGRRTTALGLTAAGIFLAALGVVL